MNKGIRIYNLFPKIAGKITEWKHHLENIIYMKFDYIYINPISQPGFSNSVYAPKEFFNINLDFVDHFSELSASEQLKDFINECHSREIKVIIEIILTHASMDSELLITKPEWFKYVDNKPKRFSTKDKGRWVEWGDLVEFDNENSSDKENLWNYWSRLLNHYISLGVDGFIFEAASKVPEELWKTLIGEVRERKEDVILIADNLGTSLEKTTELSKLDFDYLYTSIRWWDFNSPWLIEQHYRLKDFTNLISFPENYNTKRIANIFEQNINASKAWYSFTALINSGVMIPIGFEYGNDQKIDLTNSFEDDYDNRNIDIRDFIRNINKIKDNYKIFNEENDIFIIDTGNENIFTFKKVSRNLKEEALIIVNNNYYGKEEVYFNNINEIINKNRLIDISPEDKQEEVNIKYHYVLRPGEIRILYGY